MLCIIHEEKMILNKTDVKEQFAANRDFELSVASFKREIGDRLYEKIYRALFER